MGDRYSDAAQRIEEGKGTQSDRDLLQANWGGKSRFLSPTTQRYQDAVKKFDKK